MGNWEEELKASVTSELEDGLEEVQKQKSASPLAPTPPKRETLPHCFIVARAVVPAFGSRALH